MRLYFLILNYPVTSNQLLQKIFYLFIAFCLLISSASAQATSDSEPMLREEEFFQVEQLVAIGSRRSQHLSESPSAVSVITAEDIRQSGVVDIVDLFRMIPGMDVVTIDGPRSTASVRGFHQEFAPGLLVMIDRRIVFLHQQGGTVWRALPIFLEDIERIEILRGPGSTLYGINAFTGVINIITKDPKKYEGLILSSTFGSNELGLGALIHDQVYHDRFSYRFSLGFQQDEGFDETFQGTPLTDSKRFPKTTFQARYDLSGNSSLRLSSGYLSEDRQGSFPVPGRRTGEPGQEDLESFFLHGWYENRFSPTSSLFIQSYWNAINSDFNFSNPVVGVREFDFDTLGAEFQYNHSLLKRHQLVFGGDYILDFLDAPQFGINTIQDSVFGFYIQDEYKPLDPLVLVGGIRIQDNTISGTDVTSRGTFLYTPWKNNTFRFSVGQAVVPPSQIQSFIDTTTPLPNGSVVARLPNRNLDSGEVTAYEIGYRTYLFNKLNFNVELYYNDINKLAKVVPTLPPSGVTSAFVTSSQFQGFSKGVEVELTTPLTYWLQGRINYTHEFIDIADEKSQNPGLFDKSVPRHKANLGLRAKFENGFSANLQLNYVDHRTSILDQTISLDPYFRLDVRVAKTFLKDAIEVAMTGQNLVNPHAESEFATFDRLLFASMTWRL